MQKCSYSAVFRIVDSLLLPLQVMESPLLMWKESGSYLYWKVPKMMALTKLSFLCLTVPVACTAGKQELSWELQAAARWHVTSPPWHQPTFLCPFPPPTPQKQHPSEREEEQAFGGSLCGSRWVTNHTERTYFSQAGGLCPTQQL